jgi:hypothetical protein
MWLSGGGGGDDDDVVGGGGGGDVYSEITNFVYADAKVHDYYNCFLFLHSSLFIIFAFFRPHPTPSSAAAAATTAVLKAEAATTITLPTMATTSTFQSIGVLMMLLLNIRI